MSGIDTLLRERIASAAAFDVLSNPHHVRQNVARRQRRIRRRRGIGAVLGILAVVGLAAGAVRIATEASREDDFAVQTTQPATSPATSIPPASDVAGAWSRLPSGPLAPRTGYASVWTGRDLLIWSGASTDSSGATSLDDGAAYNAGTGEWRPLSAAPVPGRFGSQAVWTGTEMVVLGGEDPSGPRLDAVAYNPLTDTWRQLPNGLPPGSRPLAASWSQHQVLVATTTRGDNGGVTDIVQLSPTSSRWTSLPPPPISVNRTVAFVESSSGQLLVGGLVDELGNSLPNYGGVVVQQFDQSSGGWTVLTQVALLPQAAVVAELDGRLVAVDYQLGAEQSDDGGQSWTNLSELPLNNAECIPEAVPADGALFIWYCGQVAILNPSGSWVPVTWPDLAGVTLGDMTISWAGHELLIWGRDFDTGETVMLALSPSTFM